MDERGDRKGEGRKREESGEEREREMEEKIMRWTERGKE